MLDAIVDDLEIPNERIAWIQAAESFQKPVFNRSETEMSRIVTLVTRLPFFAELPFEKRLALCKVAKFRKVGAGEVLVTVAEEGDDGLDDEERLAGSLRNLDEKSMKLASEKTGLPPQFLAGLSNKGNGKAGPLQAAMLEETFKASGLVSSTRQNTPGAERGGSPPGTAQLRLQEEEDELDHQREPRVKLPTDIFTVIFGSVALRLQTATGRAQTLLYKGETFGQPLTVNALPSGSTYVATEALEVLVLPHSSYVTLLEHLEAETLRDRVRFFQSLLVPVFSTWDESDFLALAKSVYPLNYQSKEVSVQEGDPGDAIYFITSGTMKVVREIDFTQSLGHPCVKLLELATLNKKEYYGELSLIRYSVDDNKKNKFVKIQTVQDFDCSDGSDDEREVKRVSRAIPSTKRQATVYAHQPTSVLVLHRTLFISLVFETALVRMREYAKGYPSEHDIRQHFLRQQRWSEFKHHVMGQVSGQALEPPGKKK